MKNTKELIQEFEQQMHNERLKDIYLDEQMIPYQNRRCIKSLEQYQKLFGAGEVEMYSAPGRSEVGGNHTDHQQGMVLAASVNLDALAVAGRTDDGFIQIVSDGYPLIKIALDEVEQAKRPEESSASLIKGVVSGLVQRGYQTGGFNAYITSDVLIGAGLSSSAAFEVIVGVIISGLFNQMRIPMVELAQIGQYAENVFFGKPSGLMDQTACAVGGLIHIDFEDPKHPLVNKVDVDFEQYAHSLCIVDTKGSHADLTEDYAAIPIEMKQVAAYFDKPVLRVVAETDFYQQLPAIRTKLGDRAVLRAIHFFEEEKRVMAEVQALRADEFTEFLALIEQSGHSSFEFLQNVYTNKDVRNQGMSVALAVSQRILGEHGVSRVHGGGFAGTIQAFVADDFVASYQQQMDAMFGKGSCHVLKVRKYGGIKVL